MRRWAGVVAVAIIAAVAPAQPPPDITPDDNKIEAFPEPELADSVQQLLLQDYLKDEERREIRLRHGAWQESDLSDAASRSWAALVSGRFTDAALDDAGAPALDRAEALLARGQSGEALSLLETATSARAVRVRAAALVDQGRTDDAAAVIAPLKDNLVPGSKASPEDIIESVRAMLILARLRGAEGSGAVGYQQMLNVLAHVRDDLDRLSWEANLAEAELLYEKDRYADAIGALQSTLALNPRCAEAWFLLGQISFDGFDFPRAESIALRLDALAGPGSVYGALVHAGLKLRQGEGEQAELALAPALEKCPRSRPLLAAYAAAAAGRFDFAEAEKRLKAFDELSPNSPLAYMATGKTMARSEEHTSELQSLR